MRKTNCAIAQADQCLLFALHTYYNVHSTLVVLSRNIKYLASSQQGFSCDKALSTLYDQKKINHLLH